MSSIFAASPFSAALSGLAVSELRLGASSNNVANALTAGFAPDVVQAEERAEGGVSARVVKANDPSVEARIDAAALGYGAGSGADLATELVRQMAASASYRANLASVRAADEALRSLVQSRG